MATSFVKQDGPNKVTPAKSMPSNAQKPKAGGLVR